MKTWIAVAALAALSGCAYKSGVLRMGDDRYQVSANAAPARGGITSARKLALTDADKHCRSLGQAVEVENVETEYAFPANGVATVTFRCK